MTESMANATYRAFNFPHHVTTYLALYYAARNTELKTAHSWDWYLMRAANTTLKFGAPSVGVMDDTTFREILRAVVEEAAADPARSDFAAAAANITANMLSRASGRFSQPYPYGSEFAFDTTGQEAVVVWLLYFANSTNHMAAAAKETVDHILSYSEYRLRCIPSVPCSVYGLSERCPRPGRAVQCVAPAHGHIMAGAAAGEILATTASGR